MKKIYIVGGNGFARECYKYIKNIEKTDSTINFAGFLGHGGYGHTVDYLDLQQYYMGEVTEHHFSDNEYAVIGAGSPYLRKQIYYDLKELGIKFYTLITINSFIDGSFDIGDGNIFVSQHLNSHNIKIGNGNLFNGQVTVGHDVEVGDFNFFGPRSQLLGNVKVGNLNSVGANSILLPNSKIGNNNKIAPLSAVYKGCKNNSYLIGNPALKVGDIE